MRRERISEVIGMIDEVYVEEASSYPRDTKAFRPAHLFGPAAAVACLAAAVAGTMILLPPRNAETDPVSLGGLARPYRHVMIAEKETAMVWPWEYQTVYERFGVVTYDGKTYSCRARTVSESLLSEALGRCEAVGTDPISGREHRASFSLRGIRGVSEDFCVAVEMEGEHYVFLREEYAPPASFGELTERFHLTDTLTLTLFTIQEGSSIQGTYRLEDDGPIWQLLSGCKDASFAEDDSPDYATGLSISFTVTSEPLGVYKRVFRVTRDGYVWTNAFEWRYCYYIGEDAAGQIIDHAVKNATEAVPEPCYFSLAGTLTEIGDNYILIDDSILCRDADDGMVFRVPTDSVFLKRYLDCIPLHTGDTVVVPFTGRIDTANGNTVLGALSILPAEISGDRITIPE